MTTEERRIDTPHGEARLVVPTGPAAPVATLLLSHGAGGGIDTRDLEALGRAPAPQRGHRRPARAAVEGWPAARSPPRRRPWTPGWSPPPTGCETRTPLVVGGRSAGARSAARCARQLGAVRLPGAGLPAAPAGQAGEVAARRAARRPGADAGDPGGAGHVGPARGVPDRPRPGRRARRRPRLQGAGPRRASPRPTRWRSSSSPPWSGSCVRWPVHRAAGGNDRRAGRVPPACWHVLERPDRATLGDDD